MNPLRILRRLRGASIEGHLSRRLADQGMREGGLTAIVDLAADSGGGKREEPVATRHFSSRRTGLIVQHTVYNLYSWILGVAVVAGAIANSIVPAPAPEFEAAVTSLPKTPTEKFTVELSVSLLTLHHPVFLSRHAKGGLNARDVQDKSRRPSRYFTPSPTARHWLANGSAHQ
ncbi:hypothetical protein QBC44DRAFT_310717 [Cladorrhinum sp. PSN332]|nr:hypothetical protein QBC44DRAFT_310717 [Cladorrhinum sp. PSN332]